MIDLRPRALAYIRKPGPFGAFGALREEVLALRTEAEEGRRQLEAQLRSVLAEHANAERQVADCNLALAGTGLV